MQAVREYLEAVHYYVRTPFPQHFPMDFVAVNKLRYYYWEYDLAAWQYYGVGDPDFVIEIDGEKHSKTEAKIKDGIAQKWINQKFPKCKFVRIKREDALYNTWLRKKLGV